MKKLILLIGLATLSMSSLASEKSHGYKIINEKTYIYGNAVGGGFSRCKSVNCKHFLKK